MNLDELIRDAYRENELLPLGDAELPDGPELTPSPEFLVRIERLAGQPKTVRSHRPSFGGRRLLRRAAAVLIVFLSLSLAVALLFPEAVASFVRMVVRYEPETQVVEIGRNPDRAERAEPLPVCQAPWLPPGYRLADFYADGNARADYRYICMEGVPRGLMISYRDTTGGFSAGTAGVPEAFEEIRINRLAAVSYTSPDGSMPNQVSWFDERVDTYYIVSGFEPTDVLKRVAESVSAR